MAHVLMSVPALSGPVSRHAQDDQYPLGVVSIESEGRLVATTEVVPASTTCVTDEHFSKEL